MDKQSFMESQGCGTVAKFYRMTYMSHDTKDPLPTDLFAKGSYIQSYTWIYLYLISPDR